MVDPLVVESLRGASFRLHEPRFAGVALKFDRPWEGGGTGFVAILNHNGLYRMYYVGCPLDVPHDDDMSYPSYAESRDGITWARPQLGLHEFKGSRDNNILMLPSRREPYPTTFSPFIDTRPGVPADERFKATGGGQPNRSSNARSGLWILCSADGIRWRKWREDPVLVPGTSGPGTSGHDDFDMQNCAFWSQSEQCYVLYFRVASDVPPHTQVAGSGGCRTIARSTSKDLVTWTPPQRMSFGPTELEQLYSISTFPYFRAQHLYLAFPMRFVHGRRFLGDAEWQARPIAPLYAADKHTPVEVSDTVFMTSRGGYRYDRTFMDAFIPPGPDPGNWVSRDGMCASGIIQTGPTEISLYRQHHFAQSTAYLGRYTMRLDGFGSVRAPRAGGEMVTKPLLVTGEKLVLNVGTSAAGSFRVEVQEPDGEPIPGFMLTESRDFVGDAITYEAVWGRGHGIGALRGRTVRLRFVLQDADLYSIRFSD